MKKRRLGRYVRKYEKQTVAITIEGLCKEYEKGVESLLSEPWFRKEAERKIIHAELKIRSLTEKKCPEVLLVLE